MSVSRGRLSFGPEAHHSEGACLMSRDNLCGADSILTDQLAQSCPASRPDVVVRGLGEQTCPPAPAAAARVLLLPRPSRQERRVGAHRDRVAITSTATLYLSWAQVASQRA